MNQIDRSLLATQPTVGLESGRRPPNEHEKLVQNTQKWVAQTFYGAMLKEMRKSPWRSEQLEGGRGGEAFEEMFDQRIADHMSQSAGSPLVNSIVNRIEAKQHAHSAKNFRDAKTAYALATRRAEKKDDLRGKPLHAGEIPWNRKHSPEPLEQSMQAETHKMPAASLLGQRREDRILPEIYHVAPTN